MIGLLFFSDLVAIQEIGNQLRDHVGSWHCGRHPDRFVAGLQHSLDHRLGDLVFVRLRGHHIRSQRRLINNAQGLHRIQLPQDPGCAGDVTHQKQPGESLQIMELSLLLLFGKAHALSVPIQLGHLVLQQLHCFSMRRVDQMTQSSSTLEGRCDTPVLHQRIGVTQMMGDLSQSQHNGQRSADKNQCMPRKNGQQMRCNRSLTCSGWCNSKNKLRSW
mmetsp:Transcript_1608/g.3481  ORF Transcript_1608/g.3481 Transcript_1608/m.3481 type:complete len:217 (+) Transcript_1608:1301-1951(+)